MAEGQGRETSSAQLVTECLGVRFDSIDYVVQDTARVAAGAARAAYQRALIPLFMVKDFKKS
jgi:CO/xanthine dehydrogenase Mo-binding subunit